MLQTPHLPALLACHIVRGRERLLNYKELLYSGRQENAETPIVATSRPSMHSFASKLQPRSLVLQSLPHLNCGNSAAIVKQRRSVMGLRREDAGPIS